MQRLKSFMNNHIKLTTTKFIHSVSKYFQSYSKSYKNVILILFNNIAKMTNTQNRFILMDFIVKAH